MRWILFYLDGVFYAGDKAVPGAAESLEWVRPGFVLFGIRPDPALHTVPSSHRDGHDSSDDPSGCRACLT